MLGAGIAQIDEKVKMMNEENYREGLRASQRSEQAIGLLILAAIFAVALLSGDQSALFLSLLAMGAHYVAAAVSSQMFWFGLSEGEEPSDNFARASLGSFVVAVLLTIIAALVAIF